MTHTKTNVIQYNEYYPFGLQTANSWTRENTTGNNYLYNAGSELNAGNGWYEMFFRGYDPALGRMLQVDPMVDKYADWSPYHYSVNNPIRFNDPLGAEQSNVICQTCNDMLLEAMTGGYQGMTDWAAQYRTPEANAMLMTTKEFSSYYPDAKIIDYYYTTGDGEAHYMYTEIKAQQGDPTVPVGPLPKLPNIGGFEHAIGPGFLYLSSPAAKPYVAMKGPYTSTTSSVLSKALRALPEKKIAGGKMFTHTVNGAKKYATTWNTYLGRWGTKVLGPIGAALTIYDGVSLLTPYFKGALEDYRSSHPIEQSGNLIYHLPH